MKSAVKRIVYTLLNVPSDQVVVRGHLGSGPFARPLSDDPTTQKIILPGDTAETVALALFYFLWDLSVDLGLGDDVRQALRQEFKGCHELNQ